MALAASSTLSRHVASADPEYWTAGQIRERFQCSDMWIVRRMREHGFPAPIKFGGKTSARRWRVSEVLEWERSRVIAQ
jgi:predicted DNA-binding transcriptional regulator AlpA